MTANETSDKLRALVKELRYEAADQTCFLWHARLHNQAANAIDALLARLTAVEEENDELHEDLVRVMQERNAAIARLTATEADADRWERAYRFLALRERPQ